MISSILRLSAVRCIASRTFAAAAGQQLKQLTGQLPHFDVVRYEHKNRTWSLQHTDYYSDALAVGLLEFGLQKGDVVLSFLPDHLSEQVSVFDIIYAVLRLYLGDIDKR
jgi:non-ribosomal peptide synthetase component E (peptide arylation enzyme)